MATTDSEPTCEYCGGELAPEEIQYPYKGELICCECEHEHKEFICHWCQNYDDIEHECEIGSLFALFEPVRAREPIVYLDGQFQPYPEWYDADKREMKPGIYRIKQWPIYWSAVFAGGLFAESFERVADLTDSMKHNGGRGEYSCGPLCRECGSKYDPVKATPANATYPN